jgi:hypothetical protein
MHGTRRRRIAGGALVALLLLGACSESSRDDDADASSGDATATEDLGTGGSGGDASPASVDLDFAAARAPERARQVISTAELTLRATDPDAATTRASVIARDAGGYLFSQNAELGDDESVEAVYKVPPDHFDSVVAAMSELGEVEHRNVDTEDVTGEVVDLEARLASARTSVERLRELLGTSGGVADLLAVEQALAQREGEMEALAAQLAALRARVDLATITLRITTLPGSADTEVGDDIPGFVAGLRTGGAAFGNTVLIAATALGFAAPFLAVALLLGVPAWVFSRRRRTSAVRA